MISSGRINLSRHITLYCTFTIFNPKVYQQCPDLTRKYRGIFEEASPEKQRQVRKKHWSQQVEHMQVPKGRDQVSGGVSVPCRHATPVANVLWKPLKIR